MEDMQFDSHSVFHLLDIGCEAGSFLHYIQKNFDNAELTGMDIMPELLEKVNEGADGHILEKKIATIHADISNPDTLPPL